MSREAFSGRAHDAKMQSSRERIYMGCDRMPGFVLFGEPAGKCARACLW